MLKETFFRLLVQPQDVRSPFAAMQVGTLFAIQSAARLLHRIACPRRRPKAEGALPVQLGPLRA